MTNSLRSWVLILIALLVCSPLSYAQKRTQEDAMNIARSFLTQHSKASQSLKNVPLTKVVQRARQQAVDVPELNNRQKGDGLYIISDTQNKNFVIVSGDERMKDVLGYSLESDFNEESIAPGLLDLMNGYQRAFDAVQLMPNVTTREKAETRSVTAIEPLIKTKWGQGSPYNDLCPDFKNGTQGEKCQSGCVATAMAQVMNYYKYPDVAQGYISYQTNWGDPLKAYLSSIPLDWDNMCDEYNSSSTLSQKEAVANLMKVCGYSVYMNYGYDEKGQSGAFSENMVYALINYFSYNPNLISVQADYFTWQEWNKMLCQELEKGRPVLYSGRSNEGGHRFIVDGTSWGYFHINFGWSGESDGYYDLSEIKEKVFNSDHSMILGMCPELDGIHQDVFYLNRFSFSSLQNPIGSSESMYLFPYCYSSSAQTNDATNAKQFKGEAGVGLFNKDFNFIRALLKDDISCYGQKTAIVLGEIKFDSSVFNDGSQYYIAPYVKSDFFDEVSRIKTKQGLEDWYLATTKDGVVTLTLKGEMGNDEPEPVVDTITEGYYNALAYDATVGKKDWQITISKDKEDNTKYWIGGLDPIVSSKGYTYEKGWNKVYGTLNNIGTRLIIPANQPVGDGINLRGMGDADDIEFIVSSDQSTLTISEPWGSYKNDGTVLSKYTDAVFVYKESDIDKPLIILNEKDKTVSISTSTENARIFYTLDGKTPTISSFLYQTDIVLEHNCTVMAIAEKNGKTSEVVSLFVEPFVVEKPTISWDETKHIAVIKCSTEGAVIHYTLDGSEPTENSAVYSEAIQLNQTTTVKAIALKKDFKESPVETKTISINPAPSPVVIVVNDNVAGKLNEHIDASSKLIIENLTVSGNLNGDDIRYIREMLSEGKLSALNLSNANIISGGGSYMSNEFYSRETKDNTIGNEMFSKFANLVTLKLPNSATIVESFAVSYNKNLLEVVLPNACTSIESYAFAGNRRLPSISLPAALKEFNGDVLDNCPLLEFINVDSGNTMFTSVDGVLFTKDLRTVVWYSSYRNDETYTVPEGVENIGSHCFEDAKLEKVVLPDGLKNISKNAFSTCKNLSLINIPVSVETIDDFAFWSCNFYSIDLCQISKLGSYSFSNNSNLTKVQIGSNLAKVEGSAFENCNQLKSIDVDENNPNYSSENGILFTKNRTQLCKYPVAKTATYYVVPEEVISINDHAFSGCYNLENIIVGKSVEEIGTSAFNDSKCKYIKMESDSKVARIGMLAFQNCDSLRTLVIPNEVQELPSFFAAYCESLEYVKFPKRLTKIDSYAFTRCMKLVTIESDIVDIAKVNVELSYSGDSPFDGIKDDCLWIVPEGTAEAYKACSWWVNTWRIKENVIQGIKHVQSDDIKIRIENGNVTIMSPTNVAMRIYNINGQLAAVANCIANTPTQVALPAGLYLINGRKYVVGNR